MTESFNLGITHSRVFDLSFAIGLLNAKFIGLLESMTKKLISLFWVEGEPWVDITYRYDIRGQLLEEGHNGQFVSYAYDVAENRVK